MKVPSTSMPDQPLPGMSVRDTAQAIGTAEDGADSAAAQAELRAN